MSPLSMFLIAWAAMAVMMVGLWYVQYRTSNAGIVDIAWSFGTGLCAIGFAAASPGDAMRRGLLCGMAGIWAARLGFYLIRRVFSEAEDGRYRMLREKWGERTQPMLFGFFQVQALWAALFALPMLAAARGNGSLGARDAIAVALWVVSVAGESMADAQMGRFRADPAHRGQVCRDGLWGWSRHPNYFFEWIHWFAYPLMAGVSPFAWVAWAGPCLMLFFLTKVTGIPVTEARSLISRPETYRAYQREVSAFIPLPPRRSTDV
jgi:steroid 5-alpha reductase family enzyme